jgi:DNA-binding SARP family transcriptional activator
MPTSDHPAVDTVGERYVSFARDPSLARDPRLLESQVSISVVPGRAPTAASGDEHMGHDDGLAGYPVQPAKVQCPLLRDETLARSRLLDWLAAKIHHRVLFVVAEAGYGKTTLLADFSRRTRLRTLWYRLDSRDRDWVAFVSHLIASGREHDPSFGPATDALLHGSSGAEPTRETVTAALVRDVMVLGTEGAIFVLDDYHTVDESPDVKAIVGELIAHAPERVTFVFASRRLPSVRVARLRALGEVAELSTDDLRFSEPETDALFRETYGRPLDRDVLGDLSSRTEGWAASLQLVQAALRDRTAGEIRTFVRSLTGAEGDLYDYLAEEVIGGLPEDLQAFLMKVSVLETVDPRLVASAAEVESTAAADYLASAERIGVLGRRGRNADAVRGFHPLVRDFLRARLAREAGEANVAAAHLRIARASEGVDWTTACFHYAAAGRPDEIHRVLRESLRFIIGTGQFQLATAYLDSHRPPAFDPELEAIRGRGDFSSGRRVEGLARLEHAAAIAPESDVVLTNLLSVAAAVGDLDRASEVAASIADRSDDPVFRSIAGATASLLRLGVDGNISTFRDDVLAMAETHHAAGLTHYEGISLHNAAAALRAQGDAHRSFDMATRAVDLLRLNSRVDEVGAARQTLIWALAHVGRWRDAEREIRSVLREMDAASAAEALTAVGTICLWYGTEGEATSLLDAARTAVETRADLFGSWLVAEMELAIRHSQFAIARQMSGELRSGHLSPEMGFSAHCRAIEAYLAVAQKSGDAPRLVDEARELADSQEAYFWSRYCSVLSAARADATAYSIAMMRAVDDHPVYLSILAELIADRLFDADEPLLERILSEARLRPERWRTPLRLVADADSPSKWSAGRVLDEIGEHEDVARLRALAKSASGKAAGRALGRRLSRRLAPHVFVEDQLRVAVCVGNGVVPGGEIRRKVLALLCFLVSRRGFSATRDEVLEALWPELEPTVALNSLNQTVYFLRRVFEPDFNEDLSPGYVQHDSNILWLDTELVTARSAVCWDLVRKATGGWSPADVEVLASNYVGKFALDFAYEDWAIAYRDSLHAAFLQVVETAIALDTGTGAFDRAIDLARRALAIDPDAEQIEISLLRLYRLSGAHSAAAEQYAHYANAVRREIGVEPPAIEMV